jgi:hypothetical protein
VLALTGDASGAVTAINAAMPGSSASLMPFLQRLPTLQAGQKAAAANLGIFPDSSDARLASASMPTPSSGAVAFTGSVTNSNRLSGIDQLLQQPTTPQPPVQQPVYRPQQQRQVAYAAPTRTVAARAQPKIWLQLASGPNAAALKGEFQQIKSKNEDLFDGIPGYVAQSPDRARLVVGPFRSASDADTFAEDLQTVDVKSFKWSNSPTDRIVPLGTE